MQREQQRRGQEGNGKACNPRAPLSTTPFADPSPTRRRHGGLSPATTVGRFATVEDAQVATDEVWAPS
jgi:hypothetical protein